MKKPSLLSRVYKKVEPGLAPLGLMSGAVAFVVLMLWLMLSAAESETIDKTNEEKTKTSVKNNKFVSDYIVDKYECTQDRTSFSKLNTTTAYAYYRAVICGAALKLRCNIHDDGDVYGCETAPPREVLEPGQVCKCNQ